MPIGMLIFGSLRLIKGIAFIDCTINPAYLNTIKNARLTITAATSTGFLPHTNLPSR